MNFAGDAAVCPDMARANHSCGPNAGRRWQYLYYLFHNNIFVLHFLITTYLLLFTSS